MFAEVATGIPPIIAAEHYPLTPATAALIETATLEMAMLDATHDALLGLFEAFLLCAESVAPSRIEHANVNVNVSMDDLAKAVAGVKAPKGALESHAATRALRSLVATTGDGGPITEAAVLTAHRLLMADDPTDGRYAGRWRDVQNWIGGSDYPSRGAVHVPPPPEMVEECMGHLLAFAGRTDMPAQTLTALVHAQFESVHPFTDGNGHIGRALIHAVLRRRLWSATVSCRSRPPCSPTRRSTSRWSTPKGMVTSSRSSPTSPTLHCGQPRRPGRASRSC